MSGISNDNFEDTPPQDDETRNPGSSGFPDSGSSFMDIVSESDEATDSCFSLISAMSSDDDAGAEDNPHQ
jgi:hypothetical protein